MRLIRRLVPPKTSRSNCRRLPALFDCGVVGIQEGKPFCYGDEADTSRFGLTGFIFILPILSFGFVWLFSSDLFLSASGYGAYDSLWLRGRKNCRALKQD